MIVCSCNVLSEEDVRSAVATGTPHNPSAVYGCLGCSAQCGRCARTIKRIIKETTCNTTFGGPASQLVQR